MGNVMIIFRRELKSYFNTPIAYIFVPLFIGVPAWRFLQDFYLRGEASMRAYFEEMPLYLAILISLLGMRTWSDELRSGTAELLLTLPFKIRELVLGKFLAAAFVISLCLACTIGLPIMVGVLGEPDWGPIITGYIGCLLLGFFLLSIAGFFSSITQNQMIAGVLSLLLALIFIMVLSQDAAIRLNWRDAGPIFRSLGVPEHLASFTRGLLTVRDCVYFISLSVFFSMLTVFSLGCRRY